MSTSTQRLGPYAIAQRVTYSATEDPTTGMDLPVDGEIRFFCSGTIRGFFREDPTNSRFDVSGSGTSTGTVIAVEDANDLTTGSILSLYSNASGGQTRSLIKVVNDNAGAALTTCLHVQDDGEGTTTCLIDKNGTTAGAALVIDTEQTGGDVITILPSVIETGNVIDVLNADSLTTGRIANFASSSTSSSTRSLVNIVNGSSSATGATCLELHNNGANIAAMKIEGTGSIGIDFTALTGADVLFNCTAGTGSTAAPQTNAPVGFINIQVAGTSQWIPYYGAT